MSENATRTPPLLLFPDRRENRAAPRNIIEKPPAPEPLSFAGRATTGVLSHQELEEQLVKLGEMQPQAPLSFLAVEVHGLGELALSDWRRPSDIVDIMAHNVRSDTRVTDFVGRLGGSTIGVILQGTNSKQSSIIAERLRSRLARLSHTAPPIQITVSAASGRGINASVLPSAALSPLGESC